MCLALFSVAPSGRFPKVHIRVITSRVYSLNDDRSTSETIQRRTFFQKGPDKMLHNYDVTTVPVTRELLLKTNSTVRDCSRTIGGVSEFFNICFDKGRLKKFVLWFSARHGEHKTVKLVEQLKNMGFQYARKAGISLGIDDLVIPQSKNQLLKNAEKITRKTVESYKRGDITGVERYQRLIDTWHNTSESVKQAVIENFQKTPLNPVYMMAFSGARGNISQVRQLVGMRGLMADPQGQIIDYPIRSNFREGLTLTEYLISSYGARKGTVDTALRTANAGYLTRRLVDVAQHVIVSNLDCGTKRGIYLTGIKEGKKTIHSLQKRAVGRVLARPLVHSDLPPKLWNETPEKAGLVYKRNQEITPKMAALIGKKFTRVFVRSPLTCDTYLSVCQLCYGWSLARAHLVSIGEAVGVVAAQSIGEPGTQLTMRTFHTGGVFSGDVLDMIRAPFTGTIRYNDPIPGTLIRTPEGQIVFLTKNKGSLTIVGGPSLPDNSANSARTTPIVPHSPEGTIPQQKTFMIPAYTLLYKRNGQTVHHKQVIACVSSQKRNATDSAEYTIQSDQEGQFFIENAVLRTHPFFPLSRRDNPTKGRSYNEAVDCPEGTILQGDTSRFRLKSEALTWGYAWLLAGRIFSTDSFFAPNRGDFFIVPKGQSYNITRQRLLSKFSHPVNFNKNQEVQSNPGYSQNRFFLQYREKIARKTNSPKGITIEDSKFFQRILDSSKNIFSTRSHQIKRSFYSHPRFSHKMDPSLYRRDNPTRPGFCHHTLKSTRVDGPYQLVVPPSYNKLAVRNIVYINTNIKNNDHYTKYKSFLYSLIQKTSKNPLKKEDSTTYHRKKSLKQQLLMKNKSRFPQKKIPTFLKNDVFKNSPLSLRDNPTGFPDCLKKGFHFIPKGRSPIGLVRSSMNIRHETRARREGEIVTISKVSKHDNNCMVLTKADLFSYYFERSQIKQQKATIVPSGQPTSFPTDFHKNYVISDVRIKTQLNTHENINKQTLVSGLIVGSPNSSRSTKEQSCATSKGDMSLIDENKVNNNNNKGIIKPEIPKVETSPGSSRLVTRTQNGNFLLGDFIVQGTVLNISTPHCPVGTILDKMAARESGQIIHYNKQKVTVRRAQPIYISPKATLHKNPNDFVEQNTPVITLQYQRLVTGDIVQGIPKIEQLFEARTTTEGRYSRGSLPSILKAIFQRTLTKYPNQIADRRSVYFIQKMLVDSVQRVYQSQGVTIADKHLEVIVKQMTSKVRILKEAHSRGARTSTRFNQTRIMSSHIHFSKGMTPHIPQPAHFSFFPGELVDRTIVEKINLSLNMSIKYEPVILGISQASLRVNSFLSASSFQHTTVVLSKAAFTKQKDFLRGLKENVMLGLLIPAGTGSIFVSHVNTDVNAS